MNQGAIPGADVEERGRSSALGQASHSSGRDREGRVGSQSADRSWKWAVVCIHRWHCLYSLRPGGACETHSQVS